MGHNIVLLYSPSGAGKTSLINTQILSISGEDSDLDTPEVWPVALVRGAVPKGIEMRRIRNIYVWNALSRWVDSSECNSLLTTTLTEFLNRPLAARRAAQRARVLIFDQFEDLFTAYTTRITERADFFEQVAEALDGDPYLRVVFSMREEYAPQMDRYAELLPGGFRVRFRLDALSKEAALEAIKGPVESQNHYWATGAAEELLESRLMRVKGMDADGQSFEAMGDSVEPVLLQVVCAEIWEKHDKTKRDITVAEVQKSGDVGHALQRFYEGAIRSAASAVEIPGYEARLRNWVETQLITPAGTRGTAFRLRDTTGGVLNAAVVELERQHLIRFEERAGGSWCELTHDMLIEPIRQFNREVELIRVSPATFTGKAVSEWLENRESVLHRYRKLRLIQKRGLYDLLAEIPDKPQDREIARQSALLFLAVGVLDGTFHFSQRFGEDVYPLIAGIWLDDVKRFMAYLGWENAGDGWDPNPERHYGAASAQLRAFLRRDDLKAPRAEFKKLATFFERSAAGSSREDLIRQKANRMWRETGLPDSEANWRAAGLFVQLFYDNIASAVLDEDPESALLVLKAFQCTPIAAHAHHLINVLEAAAAIYFLSSELVERLTVPPNTSQNGAGQVTISTDDWPSDFRIPKECSAQFVVDQGSRQLKFAGAMTVRQKQALLDQIPAEYAAVANEIFTRSRSLLPELLI
jgi:hypothetical protein